MMTSKLPVTDPDISHHMFLYLLMQNVVNLSIPPLIKRRRTASLLPSAEIDEITELRPEGNLSLHPSPDPTHSETLRNMIQSDDKNQTK